MNRPCDIAINCEDATDPIANLSSYDVIPAAGRCAGLDCPGDLFGNLSVECGDVDYLSDKFRCFCVGDPLNIRFRAPGIGPWVWTVGDLPDGIVSVVDFFCPEVLTIFGHFTAPGRYEVPISVRDGFGNVTTVTLILCVLLITSTTLPTPVVGVPYSFQLQALGGSGIYAWKIKSGSLAPGLFVSQSGLISGTPTGGPPESVTFHVIDIECETPDITYTIPFVALSGTQTTTTRTWLGFNEFIPSDPPKRYKSVSWTGNMNCAGTGLYHKGLSINLGYCGTTSIDADGNPTSSRDENGYSGCHADAFGNCFSPGGGLVNLTGCLFGPAVAGTIYSASYGVAPGTDWRASFAGNWIRDIVWGAYLEAGYSALLSGTQAEKKGRFFGSDFVTNVDRTVTLSDEYTDAEANARAVVVNAPGLVAFNAPRNGGFYDQRASVAFTLECHNLMIGQGYEVTATVLHSNGVIDLRTYNFTASAVDYTINDTVAVPAAEGWAAVLSSSIQRT